VGENEMAPAKRKSQLFKFKELPPYPTLLAEEMAKQIFILVCLLYKQFDVFGLTGFFKKYFRAC